nr:pyridoxal-phosphate dependent enzyme [Sinorhizobium alkalisoli]
MPAAGPSLVTASAGNFGQGLAHAAAKRGRKAIVFAATNANPLKIAAMQRVGAEVILHGDDFDAAKAEARRFAETKGCAFIQDGAHPAIGQWPAAGDSSQWKPLRTGQAVKSIEDRMIIWRESSWQLLDCSGLNSSSKPFLMALPHRNLSRSAKWPVCGREPHS